MDPQGPPWGQHRPLVSGSRPALCPIPCTCSDRPLRGLAAPSGGFLPHPKMTTGTKQFWKGRQLVQRPMSCGQQCPARHRHVRDVCCEGPSDRLSVPSSWEGGNGGGLRTHPHRALISAPTQGVARITCSCPYPTHISLSLFLGPWRIVQPRLHSTSTCVLSGKGGQSHHGWLPTQRGVVCEQGGEGVSGGPDTCPPYTQQAAYFPTPKAVL